jgi:hypothetical protein
MFHNYLIARSTMQMVSNVVTAGRA